MRSLAASACLFVFGIFSCIHLIAHPVGWTSVEEATKPALMSLLALYVLASKGQRALIFALLLSCAGDILLMQGESSSAFLIGMSCFGAGHVFLIYALKSQHRPNCARIVRGAATIYALLCAGLILLIAPGLGSMSIPVAVYSLLLAATATASTGVNGKAALGGALFFISDTLIATRLAHLPQLPQAGLIVMATYIAGQYLLASGLLKSATAANVLRRSDVAE